MIHSWSYGGIFEGSRVRRCERCGCVERWPLASADCPVTKNAAEAQDRWRATYIAKHGVEAWKARQYEAKVRYRERQKVGA